MIELLGGTGPKNCMCMLSGVGNNIWRHGLYSERGAIGRSRLRLFVSREENHCILHGISYYATLSDQV
jgi:hypothetical protein